MKMMVALFAGFVFTLFVFPVEDSFAVLYQYVDKNGVAGFTDNLQSIPEEYRDKAVIVNAGQGEGPEGAAQRSNPADASSSVATPDYEHAKAKPSPARRLVMSGVIIGFNVILLIVLGKAHIPEQHKKHVPRVRGVLIGVLSLYLVVAHIGDILTLLGMAWGKVESAKEESMERGKKAAKAVKTIDALLDGNAQKAEPAPDK